MSIKSIFTNLIKSGGKEDLAGTVKDIDGNIYHTVTIGTQVWMVENLKTKKFRNGDQIVCEPNEREWNKKRGAYCNLNNNAKNSEIYGRLYNGFAVLSSKGLAPEGWHIPTEKEWETLIEFLGGKYVAASKLRETGTKHWKAPNSESTNETGFTALPGGYRAGGGRFTVTGNAYLWSSTMIESDEDELCEGDLWYFEIASERNVIGKGNLNQFYGHSVRCIKD